MGAPWAIPTVECPEVAYRQGAADVCAAHGLASAMYEYGDTQAAASIAACARAALASGDAFGYVRDHVNDSAPGWDVVPMPNHDPLDRVFSEPINLQLVGSDGAGTHAVATLGSQIFDPAEVRALPLSRESLRWCEAQWRNLLACGACCALGAREVAAQAVAAREAGCVRTSCASMLVVSVCRALAVCGSRRCWSGMVPSAWAHDTCQSPCFHTYHWPFLPPSVY